MNKSYELLGKLKSEAAYSPGILGEDHPELSIVEHMGRFKHVLICDPSGAGIWAEVDRYDRFMWDHSGTVGSRGQLCTIVNERDVHADLSKLFSEPAFTFDVYMGKDGVPVVHVETPGEWDTPEGPRCRVYLNDGVAVWENPPYPLEEYKEES